MEETFRVVITGTREWTIRGEWSPETGQWERLPEPKTRRTQVSEVYGPYSKAGTARAQGSRESRGLIDATVTVERAETVWKAIE
jgi:hypothetical protein